MNVTYFLRPVPKVELSILLTVPIDYPNNPPKIDLKCPSGMLFDLPMIRRNSIDYECYHVIYMCGLRYYPIEIEYWNEYACFRIPFSPSLEANTKDAFQHLWSRSESPLPLLSQANVFFFSLIFSL